MIKNNFILCFKSLYQALNLEIKEFGDIKFFYGKTNSPSFNLVVDINKQLDIEKHNKNLLDALNYANTKKHAFLLLQHNYKNTQVLAINEKMNFQDLEQKVTCMEYDHTINTPKIYCIEEQKYQLLQVTNEEMLETYCTILSETFEESLDAIRKIFLSTYFLGAKTLHPLYLLCNDKKEAIAVSMMYLPKNKILGAGHYCWGTKKLFRGQGIMSFMVREMLNLAFKKGYIYSVAHCLDSSANLARRVGFQEKELLKYFCSI